jgi:hypothetical protein
MRKARPLRTADRTGSSGERLGRDSILTCFEQPCGTRDLASTRSAPRFPPLQTCFKTCVRQSLLRRESYCIRKTNFSRGEVWWCHHDLPRSGLELVDFVAGYSLELNLQDAWLRPFAVHAESDRTHDGVKGHASRVCRKAGVVESAGGFDSLSNDLKLGVGERCHAMPETVLGD